MTSIVLGILVVAFAAGLVVQAIRIAIQESRKPTIPPEPVVRFSPIPAPRISTAQPAANEFPCNHELKKINEFLEQCRKCHRPFYSGSEPEGLREYVNAYVLHSGELYPEADIRMKGWLCPNCKRIIPPASELPMNPFSRDRLLECPYCKHNLGTINNHG